VCKFVIRLNEFNVVKKKLLAVFFILLYIIMPKNIFTPIFGVSHLYFLPLHGYALPNAIPFCLFWKSCIRYLASFLLFKILKAHNALHHCVILCVGSYFCKNVVSTQKILFDLYQRNLSYIIGIHS